MAKRLVLSFSLVVALMVCACDGGGGSYLPCTVDGDCPAGQACELGECQATTSCAADADCQDGRVCLGGYCLTAECNEDADCGSGRLCENHVCVDGPDCDCVTDADCAPSDFCQDSCNCEPRQVTPCAADTDCAANELCLDLVCAVPPSCAADGDCPSGTVCEGGRCARPCAANADCPTAFACDQGHCRQQCIGDQTCQGNLICVNNLCVEPECGSDADCSGQLVRCHDGRCETYTPCTDDADCPDANYECLQGICEERLACSIDQNCVDAGLTDHACVDFHCRPLPPCTDEADCSAEEDCVGGRCVPHVCRGAADCPANQICSGGECIDPGNGALVYDVIILNPAGVIHEGESIQLQALAVTQAGQEVPGVELAWASSDSTAAAVDAAGLLTGGTVAGSTNVTARAVVADVTSAPVAFENLLAVQAGVLRVTVVDAANGAPVVGAVVFLSSASASDTAATDASGVATFTDPGELADVHVFSDDHDYVSLIGTLSADLLVPLPERSNRTEAGGFTGQMEYAGTGELSLGLAGTSIAGNLVDLDFTRLMGQTFNVVIQGQAIPLPAQMSAELSLMGQNIAIKDTYYVVGQNGLRTAWALGGRLPSDVLWNMMGGGSTIETVLIDLLPYFSLFNHGLHPVVDVSPFPMVVDTNDIDSDGDSTEYRPAWEDFLDLDLVPETPQTLAVLLEELNLPSHGGVPIRTAVLIAGAMTPLGFTPLGMSAEEAEGGVLPPTVMKMAPAYGGLQAGAYATMVIGFPAGSGNALPTDLAAVISLDENLPTAIDFASDFLGFPEDADWTPATRTMVSSGVAGATLFRSTFQADSGAWYVYLVQADTVTFTLPDPTTVDASLADLSQGATVTLDPIALDNLSYDALVEFNSTNLDGLNRLATAFSRHQLPVVP